MSQYETKCGKPSMALLVVAIPDLDGELFGTTPAIISVVPKAVKIICSTA